MNSKRWKKINADFALARAAMSEAGQLLAAAMKDAGESVRVFGRAAWKSADGRNLDYWRC